MPVLLAAFGGAFAVLMALGEGGLGLALVMLAVAVRVDMLLENLLQPVRFGDSHNVAPLPILLATTRGGMLAGMIGLVFTAPLLAIVLDARREPKKAGFVDETNAADAGS